MSSLQHSDMGFLLPAQFRKATHTLPTPPNSPPAPPRGLKRRASRFRLPKILQRSQPANLGTKVGKTTSSDKSITSEHANFAKEDEPSMSAFRAVPETKQPSHHVLPVLPKSTASDEALNRTTSRKLKKMPKSYHNLRACKSHNQLNSQPPKLLVNTPGLLPSPLPSDSEDCQSRGTYFIFRNPRKPGDAQVKPTEASYEYQNIVAGYCEDVFEDDRRPSKDTSVVAPQRGRTPPTTSSQQETTHSSAVTRTPPTSNMSATLRSPKRDRSSSLSSEATWLSKSFAHEDHSACIGQLERIKMNEKRLAEKSRRCCHVVQGPNDDLPASWTGERKASYATVIKLGKANDIWVPRSTSSINSQSPGGINSDGFMDVPRTPERKLSEVSAFSPWDSPADCRASACMSREREGQLRKVATYGNFRCSSKEYTPTRKSLFPIRKSSLSPVLTNSSISMSPSSSTSTFTSDCSNPDSLPQSLRGTHQVSPSERAAWTKCSNLAQLLDDLSQCLDSDSYPSTSTSTTLQLSSPAILRLRAPNSLDELHIPHLLQIFPHAPTHHLSSLAALLIAQSHLSNLLTPTPTIPSPINTTTTSSQPSPPPIKTDLTTTHPNESLNHLLPRTIATLGIRMENITSLSERERALRRRAQVVHAALHVQVQKVMAVVCGEYEEVLCRALVCLVRTVEDGEREAGREGW